MNERIKELAEQAGMHYREMSDEFCAADTDGVPLAMMTIFADYVRYDETKACAKHYLEIMRDAVEAARLEERKGMECVLDQALKDQKDAERYMHLKHILIDSTISKKFEGSTPKDIDDLLDELVRSYDK